MLRQWLPVGSRCLLAGSALGLAVIGCSDRSSREPTPEPAAAPATRKSASEAAPVVVFLGDSLTAGYNIEQNAAYPALIETRLRGAGVTMRSVNAGVSGDTTAGGLRRLDWVLRQKPAVVFVALGANDGLRGLDLGKMETNLRAILERLRETGTATVLAGMKLPPNYGAEYTQRFEDIYPQLAKEYGTLFVPFLLEGVAGRVDMTLPDGIHPTPEAHKVIATTVLPFVRQALADAGHGAT